MAAESPFDDVQFPPLSSLPFRKGDPPGAIWGFYEHISKTQPSEHDELGALNLLTHHRILNAAKTEIQCGKVVSLNWALQNPFPGGLNGRMGFEHRVFKWAGAAEDKVVLDDEIRMNTQSGSQWDGLRHWAYYKTGEFYNGVKEHQLGHGDNGNQGRAIAGHSSLRNGIHKFQGKIAGRGVLLDYFSYAESVGISFSPVDQHQITAAALDACAKAQGITLEQGDILFVRMGYIHWYNKATQNDRAKVFSGSTRAVGVKQGREEVEWLWNHHFAAVACDAPAFEVRPGTQEWSLHDYLLALWGTPIGELFELEDLAKTCKELGRYSFFVTSSPLNVIDGIASPPNAMALF